MVKKPIQNYWKFYMGGGEIPILFSPSPEIRVIRLDTEEAKKNLIPFFERISGEQKWQPGDQLSAYPISSTYFVVEAKDLNGTFQAVGGLQLVRSSETEGFPCLTAWPELDLGGKPQNADVALIAIDQRYRGSAMEVFWLLCIEMWRYCKDNDICTLWAELPPRILKVYQRFGWPFEIVGELREHWGEPCFPGRMSISTIYDVIEEKSKSSHRYAKFLEQVLRS